MAASQDLPRVIFEGGSTPNGLTKSEQQPENLLQPKSPSVVLVAEARDQYNNLRTAGIVISVDLTQPWPEDCQLKLKVDFYNM